MALFGVFAIAVLLLGACGAPPERPRIEPAGRTEPAGEDADDPAVWIHPTAPESSLILGTNKAAAPDGAIVVYGLDGKILQRVGGIDRPNNVDVEYGLLLGGKPVDIAVATERYQRRLRAFAIDPETRALTEVSGALAVFEGEAGERGAPMGVGLYKRPSDGAVFAVVSRKEGPAQGYLWQYLLEDDGQGRVGARKVRELGTFSGTGEIEAVAVDDARGHVFYSDEGAGIREYHADPDHPEADKELALFGQKGFAGDREGIAIYSGDAAYVIVSDQIAGNSRYHLFDAAAPGEILFTFYGGADETDGIEATAAPLGPQFPGGLLVAMNSSGRNFLIYDWGDIERVRRAP